jgi:site-specific DNA-adenine methylase
MSLAYWGSKKKLASAIADELCEHASGRARVDYYEPFCGMASVGIEVMRRSCFQSLTWTDTDENIITYWNAVRAGWLPDTRPITDAQWNRIRRSPRASARRSFYGFHYGWGGHFLAGRRPPDDKNSSGALRLLRDRIKRVAGDMQRAGRSLVIQRNNYQQLVPRRGSVIYCDPPYVRAVGANRERHFTDEEMRELWAAIRRWIVRDGCAVYLSASDIPRAPPGLRAHRVRSWTVYNNTSSIREHAPRHRAEHLLRVVATSSRSASGRSR